MCRFHILGCCSREDSCGYAHSVDELRRRPDLYRTSVCPELINTGVCNHRATCRFAHNQQELRQRSNDVQADAQPQKNGWSRNKIAAKSGRIADIVDVPPPPKPYDDSQYYSMVMGELHNLQWTYENPPSVQFAQNVPLDQAPLPHAQNAEWHHMLDSKQQSEPGCYLDNGSCWTTAAPSPMAPSTTGVSTSEGGEDSEDDVTFQSSTSSVDDSQVWQVPQQVHMNGMSWTVKNTFLELVPKRAQGSRSRWSSLGASSTL